MVTNTLPSSHAAFSACPALLCVLRSMPLANVHSMDVFAQGLIYLLFLFLNSANTTPEIMNKIFATTEEVLNARTGMS